MLPTRTSPEVHPTTPNAFRENLVPALQHELGAEAPDLGTLPSAPGRLAARLWQEMTPHESDPVVDRTIYGMGRDLLTDGEGTRVEVVDRRLGEVADLEAVSGDFSHRLVTGLEEIRPDGFEFDTDRVNPQITRVGTDGSRTTANPVLVTEMLLRDETDPGRQQETAVMVQNAYRLTYHQARNRVAERTLDRMERSRSGGVHYGVARTIRGAPADPLVRLEWNGVRLERGVTPEEAERLGTFGRMALRFVAGARQIRQGWRGETPTQAHMEPLPMPDVRGEVQRWGRVLRGEERWQDAEPATPRNRLVTWIGRGVRRYVNIRHNAEQRRHQRQREALEATEHIELGELVAGGFRAGWAEQAKPGREGYSESEDTVYVSEVNGGTFADFDGVSDPSDGRVASQAARDKLHAMGYEEDTSMRRYFEALSAAVEEATEVGHTTAVVARLLRQGSRRFANIGAVGDSLALLVRGDRIVVLNREETLRNDMIRDGKDEDEANKYPNVLTNFLGTGSKGLHEAVQREVFTGDLLILLSDGVWKRPFDGNVDAIHDVLVDDTTTPQEKARLLVEQSRIHDDKSVVVVEITDEDESGKES